MPTRNEVSSNSPSNGGKSAPTTSRATEAAHETVDKLAGNAAKAEERIREAVATGEEQLRAKQVEAKQSTEKAIEDVRQYTKDNPLMAAGLAFAAGLIISRIVSR